MTIEEIRESEVKALKVSVFNQIDDLKTHESLVKLHLKENFINHIDKMIRAFDECPEIVDRMHTMNDAESVTNPIDLIKSA